MLVIENAIIDGRTQAYELHIRLSGLQPSAEYNSSASVPWRNSNMVARFETPNYSGEGYEDMDIDKDINVDMDVDVEMTDV